jgi:hypothetical protein
MSILDLLTSDGNCNKCDFPVGLENNAVAIDLLITQDPVLVFAYSRHLLPVVMDGEMICEGSPSRAQYLPGQPRDTRGYGYYSDEEVKVNAAYAELQDYIVKQAIS